jgi:hypothetical protein
MIIILFRPAFYPVLQALQALDLTAKSKQSVTIEKLNQQEQSL